MCIIQPLSGVHVVVCPYSCPWAVAAEREAGYIMLGCKCAAAAPGLLAGRDKQQQILELFSLALGPTAAEALSAAVVAAGRHGCGMKEPRTVPMADGHASESQLSSGLAMAMVACLVHAFPTIWH